jgi:uncharacterized protein (TIGR02246 family)
MKVLVIGGTGYVGSAVVRRLRATGHSPVVMVRNPLHAPGGVETRVADLTEPETLRAAVTGDIDAVVHAATPTGDWAADLEAVDTLATLLTGRTLLYLSGVWVLGATPDGVDEAAPTRPIELVHGRVALEERVRTATDLRGIVIRPGIVHGDGGGIPGLMVGWAREAGTGRHVGGPTVHWPMVHVEDLADLVVLALDRAERGIVLHGVAEPAVPVKELAAAADVAAGGSGAAEAWPESEAAAELGSAFAAALALDQKVGAAAARTLGWNPSRPDAVDDLREGSYPTIGRSGSILVQPAASATSRGDDVAAIVRLVGEVEAAQQREDVAGFTGAFQQHSVWTTAHGKRLVGLEAISDFTRSVLPGAMTESTATYAVEHVLFVGPDVAVVNIRQRPVSLGGEPLDDLPEGRPVYVLVRNEGTWQIAAGQNTQVRGQHS